jgi:hypothetical protein
MRISIKEVSDALDVLQKCAHEKGYDQIRVVFESDFGEEATVLECEDKEGCDAAAVKIYGFS